MKACHVRNEVLVLALFLQAASGAPVVAQCPVTTSILRNYSGPLFDVITLREDAMCLFQEPGPGPFMCTGTLIATNLPGGGAYVLTARHCVDITGGTAIFRYEQGPNGQINVGDLLVYDILDANVESGSLSWLDYKIVKISGSPPGVAPVPLRGYTPRLGDPVALVSHPKPSDTASDSDPRPKTASSGVVSAVTKFTGGGRSLRYTVISRGGSSGSGVLDQQGNLIAVHGRGWNDFPLADQSCEKGSGAVFLADIIRYSPIIRQLAPPVITVRANGSSTANARILAKGGCEPHERNELTNTTNAGFSVLEDGFSITVPLNTLLEVESGVFPRSQSQRVVQMIYTYEVNPDGTLSNPVYMDCDSYYRCTADILVNTTVLDVYCSFDEL